MPELPEVEYVRRFLRPAMAGARIEQVILRRANLRTAFSDDFAARLEGQTVRAVERRAKYLIVELSSGEALVMHLGMSGWFRVVREDLEIEKHDHVIFEMSNGATIVFNDPRRFGFMKVVTPAEREADAALSALGPEPLARTFTAESLARALAGRKTPLKVALLDQRTVAGLGNIYACEALHVAKLSPKRRASTLAARRPGSVKRSGRPGSAERSRHAATPTPDCVALAAAIRTVLKDAIANRHRADGDDRFRVYDHEGERCPRRNCRGTIRRIVQAGRSTFFCPICQR